MYVCGVCVCVVCVCAFAADMRASVCACVCVCNPPPPVLSWASLYIEKGYKYIKVKSQLD